MDGCGTEPASNGQWFQLGKYRNEVHEDVTEESPDLRSAGTEAKHIPPTLPGLADRALRSGSEALNTLVQDVPGIQVRPVQRPEADGVTVQASPYARTPEAARLQRIESIARTKQSERKQQQKRTRDGYRSLT